MEIAYVVKDVKKGEVDPARSASEFDAAYYRGLAEIGRDDELGDKIEAASKDMRQSKMHRIDL